MTLSLHEAAVIARHRVADHGYDLAVLARDLGIDTAEVEKVFGDFPPMDPFSAFTIGLVLGTTMGRSDADHNG
jgi:hypothetical protein